MKKSISVQCNVGDQSPVLLCSLLPEKTESCPLNLEFEEYDDVIFSVIGPRSVHLTGYFLGPSGNFGKESDDDSYPLDYFLVPRSFSPCPFFLDCMSASRSLHIRTKIDRSFLNNTELGYVGLIFFYCAKVILMGKILPRPRRISLVIMTVKMSMRMISLMMMRLRCSLPRPGLTVEVCWLALSFIVRCNIIRRGICPELSFFFFSN